jgi:aryl-alcohol dehydrogenase-like predicted oxidoreductase
MATLAIRWVLSNPAITAPIVGASRAGQLADPLIAADKGPLPAELKARLDELTDEWRMSDADR